MSCLCALAALGALSAEMMHGSMLAPLPVAFLVVIVPCFVAGTLLYASMHEGDDPRPVFVLAITFGAIGTISALSLFAMPLLRGSVPALRLLPSEIMWRYVWWHIGECAGILGYLSLRRQSRHDITAPFARAVWTVAAVAVVGGELSMIFAVAHFPALFQGNAMSGARYGIAFVLLAVLASSALAAARLPQPNVIDRAVVLAQIALTLGVAVSAFSTDFFTASFYYGRALQSGAILILIAAAVRRHSAWRQRRTANDLPSRAVAQSTLSEVRVRTLSGLAQLDVAEDQRYAEMLQLACASIRPSKPMRATLSHLEGDMIVYDAIALTGTNRADPWRKLIHVGGALQFRNSVQSLLHASSGTRAWDDVAATADGAMTTAKLIGTRAMIGTALEIGRRTHFIVFSSPQPAVDEPFSADDIHYVQIVASLFSKTFEQRQHFEQLRHQMEHDALTGLQNRVQFRKAIRSEIVAEKPFAVALVNLDRFRHLNEVHGQMICDEVLVEIAYALAVVEPAALAARLNGDEFGILLRETDIANVDATLKRLLDPFHRPFHTGDRDGTRMLSVSASVGCAVYPVHGATAEELLRSADVALAVAKEQGGGHFVVFDTAMKVVLERRRFESTEIERAVTNDELRLLYQPTFDLQTGAIVGAEALVRWDHPQRGEIQPVDFIPAAERSRQIGQVTRWVLARVVRDFLSTRTLPPGFRLFFNLSAQNLDDLVFLEALTAAVTANAGLGEALGVEITETTAMQNVEQSLTTLGLIRSLGVRVAIDDFGTGYSSLSYLKRLPVDVIKIDRSFVTGLPGDDKDGVLADTMIGICNRLKIVSLAEGIETEDQRSWLAAHGCKYGQGYLVARPLPFDQLLSRLGSNGVAI